MKKDSGEIIYSEKISCKSCLVSDGESKGFSRDEDIMEALPKAFKPWRTWGEDPTKCGKYFHTHLNHQYTFHDVLQYMEKQRARPQPSACRKENRRYCKSEKEDEHDE